jgi:hypothetical protein
MNFNTFSQIKCNVFQKFFLESQLLNLGFLNKHESELKKIFSNDTVKS